MYYVIAPSTRDYISPLLQETASLDYTFCYDGDLKEALKQQDILYISSDTSYEKIKEYLPEQYRKTVLTFKDKYNFRVKLKEFYPDYFFTQTLLDDITNIQLDFSKRYIIKPCRGFMGGAVKYLKNENDILLIQQQLRQDILNFSTMYPGAYSEEYLIEEYIDGNTEIACDFYYDSFGQPIILCLYMHPEAKSKDYVQMLYYIDSNTIQEYYHTMVVFLNKLNNKTVKNFPIHAEFKVSSDGKLIPIEFNPSRFGGMGLGDLIYYAKNVNPYSFFFTDSTYQLDHLFEQDEIYCWILGYNGQNALMKEPQHNLYKQSLTDYGQILHYRELDHRQFPVFSITYMKLDNKEVLPSLLSFNFDNVFA